jgi:hypothetical protein
VTLYLSLMSMFLQIQIYSYRANHSTDITQCRVRNCFCWCVFFKCAPYQEMLEMKAVDLDEMFLKVIKFVLSCMPSKGYIRLM